MTTQPQLFELRPAEEIERERTAEIDRRIQDLLTGKAVVLGFTLSEQEKAVLGAIRYKRGAAHAIPVRELSRRFGLDDRRLRQIVRSLRLNYRLPIGSSRDATGGGYYIIVSADDLLTYLKGPLEQVRAELQVVEAVAGKQAARELLGQLRLDESGAA